MLISIPLYKKVQARLDGVTLTARENLSGVRVIRAFCREGEEREDFAEKNRALVSTQRTAGRISALLNPLTLVIINLAILYLIYTGAIRVEMGILTQGMVIALYNYMSQILVELIKLASLIITMTKSVACARRVSAVLDIPTDVEQGEGDLAPVAGAPAVAFAGASLCYRGAAAPAVEGVSFAAMPGEVVGIIGGTGSGKSSLVAMIPRAYDACAGSVAVFGHDVCDYSLEALREKIGIVPQKVQLFRGSIRDNIKVGKKTATDDEIWAALSVAQAADFVREKEGGLDFMLEAGGKNLSGGQRQRLTIARALVRKPKILILDDSTSALDYATDAALRAALREEAKDMTVFLVSQRTSSIRHADLIVVLDDGEMVGLGRHDELLAGCAVYREIYDSQYKKEDVDNG
jgi:ABC-type multidrug transport system fused ATPase/permease subunit